MADADVTLRLDRQAVAALLTSPSGPVVSDLMRRGRAVQAEARRRCPVDRGDLRGSITTELAVDRGLPVCLVGSRLPYAIFVHEGTGLWGSGRPIRPVSARVLRWRSRGMTSATTRAQVGLWTFARESKGHPGRPFLRDALPAASL